MRKNLYWIKGQRRENRLKNNRKNTTRRENNKKKRESNLDRMYRAKLKVQEVNLRKTINQY